MVSNVRWARFYDSPRHTRDSGEARRTLVATFVGNLTCVRDPESGALRVMKMDAEGNAPELVAEFAGEAFVGELSEASGEGESELSVYHLAGTSSAALPTAVVDRRPAKDAAPRPAVKVANVVRVPLALGRVTRRCGRTWLATGTPRRLPRCRPETRRRARRGCAEMLAKSMTRGEVSSARAEASERWRAAALAERPVPMEEPSPSQNDVREALRKAIGRLAEADKARTDAVAVLNTAQLNLSTLDSEIGSLRRSAHELADERSKRLAAALKSGPRPRLILTIVCRRILLDWLISKASARRGHVQ